MKAFTQGITKQEFLTEIYKHRDTDAFIKGAYKNTDKEYFQGCAVGCSLKSVADIKKIQIKTDNHLEYETHLGVPEWLARLEDMLFENLPNELSKTWPVRFSEAINEGSDLDKIKAPFMIYLMEENLKSIYSVVYDADKFKDVKNAIDLTRSAINQMIVAHKSGDENQLSAASSAASSAAESAASAASSAARSAWSAAYIKHSEKLLELIRGCR